MDIFKTSNGIVNENIFSDVISKLNLYGKDVLIYSRLLSFGRITNINAINKIIDLLIEHIGPNGTLIIPTYTLNSYSEKKFDIINIPDEITNLININDEFIFGTDRDFERDRLIEEMKSSTTGKITLHIETTIEQSDNIEEEEINVDDI